MPYYAGKYWATCDVCGWEFYNDELMDRWDGLKVCRKDWEPRHPQEFVKSIPESTPPWTRPEPAEIDVSPTYTYTSDDPPDGTFSGELP